MYLLNLSSYRPLFLQRLVTSMKDGISSSNGTRGENQVGRYELSTLESQDQDLMHSQEVVESCEDRASWFWEMREVLAGQAASRTWWIGKAKR